MKILLACRFCCQAEHDTAVRTDDSFCIFAVATYLSEISPTADSFHNGIKHHHCFTANAIAVLIHRTAIGAEIFIPYLLAITAISFSMVAMEKSSDLYFKLVLLVIPLFHNAHLNISQQVFHKISKLAVGHFVYVGFSKSVSNDAVAYFVKGYLVAFYLLSGKSCLFVLCLKLFKKLFGSVYYLVWQTRKLATSMP